MEETCWWHGVHGSRWEYTGRKIRWLREEGWHGSCSKWAELWYGCLLCSLILLGLSLDHILLLVLSLQLELVLNLVVVEALLDVNLVQLVNYLLLVLQTNNTNMTIQGNVARQVTQTNKTNK